MNSRVLWKTNWPSLMHPQLNLLLPLLRSLPDSIIEIDEPVENIQVVHALENYELTCTSRPKWERCLLTGFVVVAYKDSIKATDTREVKSLHSLVDSWATGLFIDWEYVKVNQLTTQTLSKPILVYNINGTLNEAGSIMEMVDHILRYKNHSGRALFTVTGLGKPLYSFN